MFHSSPRQSTVPLLIHRTDQLSKMNLAFLWSYSPPASNSNYSLAPSERYSTGRCGSVFPSLSTGPHAGASANPSTGLFFNNLPVCNFFSCNSDGLDGNSPSFLRTTVHLPVRVSLCLVFVFLCHSLTVTTPPIGLANPPHRASSCFVNANFFS